MIDPDQLKAALPQSDRIRSLRVSEGTAVIIGDASGLDAAARAALEQAWDEAALKVEGIDDVRIAMSASMKKRDVIAVGAGKGGVGKSTVAANVAVALARQGRKVGLIDADIYGPSQPALFGTDTKPEATGEKTLVPVAAHGIRFLSIGMMVPRGQALAWRGPMASQALTQLLEAEWGDCDTLVIDLPPGTGDVQITLIQKARPDGAIIVSTSQQLALADAERAVDLFNRVQVPVLGLVENMAGYHCPHCGEESDPFGTGGGEAGAREMHVPFLGRLPLSPAILQASDRGAPPAAGDDADAAAFAAIAAAAVRELEKVRA